MDGWVLFLLFGAVVLVGLGSWLTRTTRSRSSHPMTRAIDRDEERREQLRKASSTEIRKEAATAYWPPKKNGKGLHR